MSSSVLLLVLFIIAQFKMLITTNPLYGQHLRVIWPRWSGNPKGLSGSLKGGVILDYFSNRFHFTYEMVRVTENRMEPPVNGRGLFNYIWDGQCDLLIADVVPTSERHELVDLTLPWVYDASSFLIPVSDVSANMNAVIKPFQWPVWLLLAISIFCVILVLNRLHKYGKKKSLSKSTKEKYITYVVGNLLSQGGRCKSNRLSIRFMAGAWVLAAFVFVQAYQATLFIYVMAPITSPLINSVYDIVDNADIHLMLRKGMVFEYMFSNSNKTLYKRLQERINAFHNSRCTLASECIRLITPGSKNIFLDARTYQIDAIDENFKRTGKCNLQLARESFVAMIASFALPKRSPYTQTVSQGLLELQEIGLIKYWDLWFRPTSGRCMRNPKGGKKSMPALSLKNLTGGFVALSIGLSLSFLVFLCELIMAKAKIAAASTNVKAGSLCHQNQ